MLYYGLEAFCTYESIKTFKLSNFQTQPRLNIFTVDNMGVMICLGQGGLRSLSASSLFVCLSVDNITQKVMNGLG